MALGNNTTSYETPNHPYQGERISEEIGLVGQYGLKNKEEVWRSQSELRSYRREARRLLGRGAGGGEEFLARLRRIGLLEDDDGLDAVLALDATDILERRLQTIVYRKGYANTIDQARQFISHGHITVGDRRVQVPSYTVDASEEETVGFEDTSPISDELHPERAEE
ncbi:30S ribosomal protein S4 [Halobacteriales archaeon QH_10_67_13]|nr:MAG: 30S ribosomal protein S4 [Halobacteriales archaeon QH_10_67_13]